LGTKNLCFPGEKYCDRKRSEGVTLSGWENIDEKSGRFDLNTGNWNAADAGIATTSMRTMKMLITFNLVFTAITLQCEVFRPDQA